MGARTMLLVAIKGGVNDQPPHTASLIRSDIAGRRPRASIIGNSEDSS